MSGLSVFFFFSSRRRHTRCSRDWSSDVCSSDLCAAWLYDLLKPHVTKVVVCDPRKNALLKAGNKSDRIDARKLAELLRSGLLSPVYQGEAEAGLRTLKELARSYLTTAKDLTRVMNRLKALYRSRAIFCVGRGVYAPHHRAEWLQRLPAAGARHRAERLYLQLDLLQVLRQEARRELLAESRRHRATHVLRKIPFLGPVRVALLIALLRTPHRFRTKRQLWAYSGLALVRSARAGTPSARTTLLVRRCHDGFWTNLSNECAEARR